jgi:hypothetical protein
MGMGGGLLAMGLMLGWIVSTNVVAVRHYWRLVEKGSSPPSRLVRVLLVGYNSFFAVALLNPMMSQVGMNVGVMAIYALLMSVVAGDPPIASSPKATATGSGRGASVSGDQ